MKTPLLLLHGALGTATHFDSVIEELKDHFDVHTITFDGHGDMAPSTYSIPQFVKNVLRYLDDHDIVSCHVFGYSMGGYVALKAAAQHPERFRQILTLGTKFNWNEEATAKETAMLVPEKMTAKIPHFVDHLKRLHGEMWHQVVRGTAKLMHGISQTDKLTSQEISSITNPVTIGLGDQDNMVTVDESKQMAEQLSKAQFKIIKDCPHPLEKVDEAQLTDYILSLLD